MQYRGSYLGVFWTILNPLFMLAIYTFVFGYIFGGSFAGETPTEHALGIFVGLVIHNFIAEIITIAPTLISNNVTFVKKVVFPLEILVASKLTASLITLAIKAIIVLIATLFLGHMVTINYIAIIPMALILIVFSFGIGLIFTSIGVFIKDLGNASQFLSMSLLFGSAVFYPVSKVPAEAWIYLKYNPLIYLIDGTRNILLWNESIPLNHFIIPSVFALLILIIGSFSFQKLRPSFPDVI